MNINRKGSKNSIKFPKITEKIKSSEKNMRISQKIETSTQPITAQVYGVYDFSLSSLIQHNKGAKRQIASLTKMMTLFCSVRLATKFKIDITKCYFRVTINAAGMRGTSAQLQSRQWITIEDLLYGLMLPSGNDAATVLAQNFGACCYYDRLGQSNLLLDLKSLDLTEDAWNAKLYLQQFVKIMNQTAKQLGMKETNYINPHGLDSSFKFEAYSVLQDQLLLAKSIFENEYCLKFMKKYEHTAYVKIINGKDVQVRKVTWKNTNILVGEPGFFGGKTGQTAFAGSCLISFYQSNNKQKYIIAVLGCASKQLRFSQTKYLVDKYINQKLK